MFEYAVWNHCLSTQPGWCALRLEQLRDTMARAAMANLPQGLGACAAALGMAQQKDTRGAQLIKALCVPRPDGTFLEDGGLLAELVAYCEQDVRVEAALGERLPKLSDYEQQVWVATQRVNLAGLPVATSEAARIAWVVQSEQGRINNEIKRLTQYDVVSGTQRDALLRWLRKQGVQAESLTADAVEALVDTLAVGGVAREVLQLRQRVCQTSTAKIEKLVDIAQGGRLHNLLVYHGASTGRYASRGGFNAQNLPRPTIDDIDTAHTVLGTGDHALAYAVLGEQVMDYAVATVRGLICAPAGHEFIDADFSSIENRVGVWIAGQQDKVDMFGRGLDEYKVFASQSLFNVPYDQVSKHQRQVSKSAVLGCLFGQGAKGLQEYARVFGVELSIDRSKEIVGLYRASYARVAQCWADCMTGALEALRTPNRIIPAGRLAFKYSDEFLRLRLPSGRVLYWYKPRAAQGKYGGQVVQYDSPEGERTLIGSAIYQNAVQAVARDLLVNALLNLQQAGYEVVMLIHDEVLAVVPHGGGDEDEFKRLMCQAPAWAEGLPLSAESWRGRRFRK
jgi:DNA polymerase